MMRTIPCFSSANASVLISATLVAGTAAEEAAGAGVVVWGDAGFGWAKTAELATAAIKAAAINRSTLITFF
jgi:hypothetical protein